METLEDWSGRKFRAEFNNDGDEKEEEYSDYSEYSMSEDVDERGTCTPEKKEIKEESKMTKEEELAAGIRKEQVNCCVWMHDGRQQMNRKRHTHSNKYEERRNLLLGEYLSEDELLKPRRNCCSRYCICCKWWCLLGMMLVSLGALMLVLLWGDDTLEAGVYKSLTLAEGSNKDHVWRTGQLETLYTVRVFNLTNPKQFMKGARPRVHEVGPYVYTLRETKENVVYKEDGKVVEYQGRPTYVFQPHLSSGREEDVVITVNIPFVNAADMVKDKGAMRTVLQMVKKMYGFDTLRRLTVGELLWGHKSRVLDWARTVQEVPYPHQQFGILMGLNDTLQKPYLMHTGKGDPSKMNKILAWNHHETLDFWYGDTCNMIRGTDASGFGPKVSKNKTLYIFDGRLCRALPLVYSSTVTNNGLEAYRFVHPDDIFTYNGANRENRCYCGPQGCPPRGVLDMKPCLFGASVGFSFPHFYKGDPKLRHLVLGLSTPYPTMTLPQHPPLCCLSSAPPRSASNLPSHCDGRVEKNVTDVRFSYTRTVHLQDPHCLLTNTPSRPTFTAACL
ncbi:hypothetical protein Pcinc_026492 [Petrolisthes cinctipes]|uniref:Scavenger receptor class B member 1 n=1 Tax=Petrolisthes cinctipes TaxID=88211 RepID=A0AAE1KA88_PETCI|nr:hypothetical protein Pcinc_026492 [Petrolisthes cinctipes]